MAAKSVETKFTCSCPELRFSADLLKNKLIIQWNLSSYEVWKPRSTEDASLWVGGKETLEVEGEELLVWHPWTGRACSEITAVTPSPPRAKNLHTQAGSDLHTQSQVGPGYTHTLCIHSQGYTYSEQNTCSCSSKH